MLREILRLATGPVLADEKHVRYMNFLMKGKFTDGPVGGGLALPILNPGHSSETLPFAAEVVNTIPYPSEAGPSVPLSNEIALQFPGIPNASFDAYRLTVGGLDVQTRGAHVMLRTFYTNTTDLTLQPSSLSFTILQAPIVIYLMTLRRQAGRLYLCPVSVSDGLSYFVDTSVLPDIQGNYIDITYQGVSFSDPYFASELAEFDFFKGDPDNGCYHKSR